MEAWQLGAVDALGLMARRELSPVELLHSLLERIDQVDAELVSWVTVDAEGALGRAKQLADAMIGDVQLGPLAGLPIGLKDVFLTAGLRTTASSKVLEDFVPDEDATSVAALRASDAVILGKVHTAEFACADPAPTRNPWGRLHTPGGSSSGSAVAVAAGMVPVTLGTQTGGSTLRPAAYNGVVGVKPTYGLISNHGVIPLAWSFDHVGILARSVADAAVVLGSVAGYDPQDPASAAEAAAFRSPVLADAATPVIGVVAPYFMDTCEPDVLEHFTNAIRVLEAAGADVRQVALPATFARIAPTFDAIAWAETAAYHEQQFAVRGSLYGPKISALIQQGARTTASDYVQAMRERHLVVTDVEDMLTDVDVLLTPATPAPAPRNTSTTGDPAYQTPWSYAGLPAVSLPSGVNTWGLPLGVQLVGGRWQDAQLLRSAAWCEQALAFTAHPPCW